MEFILIIAFILGYSSLSSKITRIASALPIKNKKRFSSLKEWIGKEIELETDDHLELAYGCKTKGILKEYPVLSKLFHRRQGQIHEADVFVVPSFIELLPAA